MTNFMQPSFALLDTHVYKIFFMTTKKQMVRVNAAGVIATRAVMAYLFGWWDRAVVQLPRDPRSHQEFVSTSRGMDCPISMDIKAPNPEPAGFSLVDFRPETTCKRYQGFCHGRMTCEESKRMPFDVTKLRLSLPGNISGVATSAFT